MRPRGSLTSTGGCATASRKGESTLASAKGLIITCEHGGNRIPREYRELFRGSEHILETHRGFDRGARGLARAIASSHSAPLFLATVSRLLADSNRSVNKRGLFSEFSRCLPEKEKEKVLRLHYHPYRNGVESRIRDMVKGDKPVLHVSVHTFTPVLKGRVRRVDLGLLYEPARTHERDLAARWQEIIKGMSPGLRIRLNYPYRGASDGFTTYLRGRFSGELYLGIELEVNSKHIDNSRKWADIRRTLIASIGTITGKVTS